MHQSLHLFCTFFFILAEREKETEKHKERGTEKLTNRQKQIEKNEKR